MICSGKSNFGICNCTIGVNIKELEEYVEKQIVEILKSSPPKEIIPSKAELSKEIFEIEFKIERLINALSESSEVSAGYISKQIDELHKTREELMAKSETKPSNIRSLDFENLGFDEKKMITAEFIDRILISGKNVNILWRI